MQRRFRSHNRINEYAAVKTVDHKGRVFGNFYTRRRLDGKGYEVAGTCIGFDNGQPPPSATVTMAVAWLEVGQTVLGDSKRLTGWRRERDAYQFSLYLTGIECGSITHSAE